MQPNDNPPPDSTPDLPSDQNVPQVPESEGNNLGERIDRLSGEAAPDISPDEFARLQRGGEIHIDSQGRIRANRRAEGDPGLSLRKRRAWYAWLTQ